MSKSKGSFITLSTLVEQKFLPLAYRYMCLSAHYRSSLAFSWDNLQNATQAYKSLLNRINLAKHEEGEPNAQLVSNIEQQFLERINDDMDLPGALAITWTMLKSSLTGAQKLALIQKFDTILGLDLIKEESLPEGAKKLIEEREIARENKEWDAADVLRDELEQMGVIIEDTKRGTTWRLKGTD